MKFKTIIEPFRIRQVQPIHPTTREDRVVALDNAGLNVFRLKVNPIQARL